MKKNFTSKEVNTILELLEKEYPNAGCALKYDTKFQLLIAVVLSAQTTDISVNKITPKLWKLYPDSRSLGDAKQSDVEKIIKSIGLYRNKSKNIIGISKALQERLLAMDKSLKIGYINSSDNKDGVPEEFDELIKLPGVGRKTANVVLSEGFNKQTIAVDTHVQRVSNRIGLARSTDTYKTETQLMTNIPENMWTKAHHLLIFHGRNICKARKPDCNKCPIINYCKFYNKNND